jgi:hypothetical protein
LPHLVRWKQIALNGKRTERVQLFYHFWPSYPSKQPSRSPCFSYDAELRSTTIPVDLQSKKLFVGIRYKCARVKQARRGVVQNVVARNTEHVQPIPDLAQPWAGALAETIVDAPGLVRILGDFAQNFRGLAAQCTRSRCSDVQCRTALELTDGALYGWMRRIWRKDYDVGFHVLQTDIIPADLAFYEQYWTSQFPKLFNARSDGASCDAITDVGRQIVVAIKSKLVMTAEVADGIASLAKPR